MDFSGELPDPLAPITDSYGAFVPRALRMFLGPYYRVVGVDPNVGTAKTTARINETIDASIFERWRINPAYRPPNLADWCARKHVDPAHMVGNVRADDPTTAVS